MIRKRAVSEPNISRNTACLYITILNFRGSGVTVLMFAAIGGNVEVAKVVVVFHIELTAVS